MEEQGRSDAWSSPSPLNAEGEGPSRPPNTDRAGAASADPSGILTAGVGPVTAPRVSRTMPARWTTAATLIGLFLASAALETGLAYVTRRDWTPLKLDADEVEYYWLSQKLSEGHPTIMPRRVFGHVLILSALRDGRR